MALCVCVYVCRNRLISLAGYTGLAIVLLPEWGLQKLIFKTNIAELSHVYIVYCTVSVDQHWWTPAALYVLHRSSQTCKH